MKFRGRIGATGNNEQRISKPVYGVDPTGEKMVRSIESSHLWTQGWLINNPRPAWKPQGERENSSSDLYPAMQQFVGAAQLSRQVRQFSIQKLGQSQPTQITELTAVLSAFDRLGRPGNPVFVGGG